MLLWLFRPLNVTINVTCSVRLQLPDAWPALQWTLDLLFCSLLLYTLTLKIINVNLPKRAAFHVCIYSERIYPRVQIMDGVLRLQQCMRWYWCGSIMSDIWGWWRVARCRTAGASLGGEQLTISLIFIPSYWQGRLLPSWRPSLHKWPGQGGRGSKELRYVNILQL